MTLPGTSGSTFASLTLLNRNLIYAAAQEDEEEIASDSEVKPIAGTENYPNPNDDTTTAPTYSGWSYVDRYGFEQAVEWVDTHVDISDLSSTLIDAFLNDWASKWRDEQGFEATENINSVPTLNELLQDERFVAGAVWLPATASGLLPPVFQTAKELKDKDGNKTGEFVQLIGIPDPLEGVKFVERTTVTAPSTPTGSVYDNSAVVDALISAQVPGLAEEVAAGDSGETDMTHFLAKRGLLPGTEDPSVMPIVPMEDLVNLLQPSQETGGGGGTTTTTRDLVFDRDQLIAQVSQLYNSWMLRQGQAPQGVVASIVDGYIRDAKAFWSGKGGQLDFDTFVRNEMRALPRYESIYRDKTPQQSEEQFLASFQNPIAQLGMGGEFNREQTLAAVQSGASPISQLERVSRTREVEVANAGGFANRLAATLQGLGAGVTS